jgi:hypothetical protein
MERGFQTSADDTGVRKVGGHMDNEGMKRAGMRRGGGKTMLALMAAGASPYASCVADFSSQPRVVLHAIWQCCLFVWWTPDWLMDLSRPSMLWR